jgi:hypothetical protein
MRTQSPWIVSASVGSLAVVAAVAAVACKAKVDIQGLEDTIRQRTSELGVHATKVACPGDVEAKPGKVFTCQVELDGKKTYALDVTITSVTKETGKLGLDTAWHDGAAVQVGKLEPVLTEQLGTALGSPISIKCGDEPLRFLDAQRKVRCRLAAGEVKSDAIIEFDEALSPTGWHLDPPLLGRARLEQALTPSVHDKTNAGVKVDCGPAALFARPASGVVWCAIADGDKRAKIKVEVDDKLTVVRWDVATPPG